MTFQRSEVKATTSGTDGGDGWRGRKRSAAPVGVAARGARVRYGHSAEIVIAVEAVTTTALAVERHFRIGESTCRIFDGRAWNDPPRRKRLVGFTSVDNGDQSASVHRIIRWRRPARLEHRAIQAGNIAFFNPDKSRRVRTKIPVALKLIPFTPAECGYHVHRGVTADTTRVNVHATSRTAPYAAAL